MWNFSPGYSQAGNGYYGQSGGRSGVGGSGREPLPGMSGMASSMGFHPNADPNFMLQQGLGMGMNFGGGTSQPSYFPGSAMGSAPRYPSAMPSARPQMPATRQANVLDSAKYQSPAMGLRRF